METILHHDYRGIPGVVFDRSPARGAHGDARNIAPDAFLPDGAEAGSGAVRFGGHSTIRVDLERPWTTLEGLSVNVICSSELLTRTGTLIDAGSFRMDCGYGQLSVTIATTQGTFSSQVDTHEVTAGGWSTVSIGYWQSLGISFGGPAGGGWVEGVSVDGQWRGALKPVRKLVIGDRLNGGNGINGVIDDVLVTRLDPLAVDRNFRDRPVDISVRHCWDDWFREVLRILNENRECAFSIIDSLKATLQALVDSARHPDVAQAAQDISDEYGRRWAAGDLNGAGASAVDLVTLLRGQGTDLTTMSDVFEDDCFRRILELIPVMECDREFTEMLTAIGERI